MFNPLLWFGVGLAGLSVVLFGVSGAMAARRAPEKDATTDPKKVTRKKRDALPPSAQATKGGPVLDDDMADIEAILKKRGIT